MLFRSIQRQIEQLSAQMLEPEYTLIPHGLHVVGKPYEPTQLTQMLQAMADSQGHGKVAEASIEALVKGRSASQAAELSGLPAGESRDKLFDTLHRTGVLMQKNSEIEGLLHALDGRYVRPAPGGDLMRTPEVLPTGRNLHGFDPFRIPSAYAVQDGAQQIGRAHV